MSYVVDLRVTGRTVTAITITLHPLSRVEEAML